MCANLVRHAGRLAIIAGVAMAAPWIVSRSKLASVSPAPATQIPAFRVGETLHYRIDWRHYAGAGIAELQVVDRAYSDDAPVWHFRAIVHTVAPLRALYPLDDQIDSFAVGVDFAGRQFQEHFREFGKSNDADVALASPGEISNFSAPRVIVPSGTHDPVAAIYSLRAVDWKNAAEVRFPVCDGQDVYELVARRGEHAKLQIAAGNYNAQTLEVRLFQSGREIPGENFRIWLANDPGQTPILCEARLPFGALRIERISN